VSAGPPAAPTRLSLTVRLQGFKASGLPECARRPLEVTPAAPARRRAATGATAPPAVRVRDGVPGSFQVGRRHGPSHRTTCQWLAA
jgi:hypothetical protein